MTSTRGGAPKAKPGTKRSRTATPPAAKNKRSGGEATPRRRPTDAPPRERDRRPGTARITGPSREQRHGPAQMDHRLLQVGLGALRRTQARIGMAFQMACQG